ncbi:hypothetical protein GGQ81_003042 [Sphingomonas desiccabilis]|nr:hypothetical protein [Sphingomonas desiccabilis]
MRAIGTLALMTAPTAADGIPTWSPTVPAGGQAELRYRY